MVAVKNVKEALRQRVWSVNQHRKPRHVDNGLAALSYIYRTMDDLQSPQWVTTDFLKKILEDEFYKSQTLGPLFHRSFDKMLPQLEKANMIEFDVHNRASYRLTREMATLLVNVNDAMSRIRDEDPDRYEEGMELHYAHCDYIRQKIGKVRPTLRTAMKEIEELRESNQELSEKWDEHARACPFAAQLSVLKDNSVASDLNSVRFESTALRDGVSTDNEQPVAGPSSVYSPIATPPRHRSLSIDAYPTPESIPRTRGPTRYPPSSPLHSHDPDTALANDMDIDDTVFAGFSSASSTDVGDDSPPPKDLTVELRKLEADMEHVARLVGAEEPTYQSIEEAYHATANQLSATELEISDLREENTVYMILYADQADKIENLERECEHLRISETEAYILTDLAEDKYTRLKAAVEEEQARTLQRLIESQQRLLPL